MGWHFQILFFKNENLFHTQIKLKEQGGKIHVIPHLRLISNGIIIVNNKRIMSVHREAHYNCLYNNYSVILYLLNT